MIQEKNDVRKIGARCCGCEACMNACPTDAISMKEGARGFLFPNINPEKCIHCGKCFSVCPVTSEAEKDKNTKQGEPDCYAAASVDEIRQKSSSGGIFQVLARKILSQGGVVFGAAWEKDGDFPSVHHIMVTEPEKLDVLSGSKYVQSRIGWTYRQVRAALKKNQKVLFSGTPCQVAGLLRFLGKEYENLITMDIVCHGVPSQKCFQAYLDETYGKNKVDSVIFRIKNDKQQSCTNGLIKFTDGTEHIISTKDDLYEKGFHRSVFLRRSCGSCIYASPLRLADFSGGDFWGLKAYNPSLVDSRGVSVIMVNSDKGRKVWDEIWPELSLCERVPVSAAIRHNRFSRKTNVHPERERFFRLWPVLGFSQAADYALERRYDVEFEYGQTEGAAELEKSLEKIANSLGRTVCLSGKKNTKPKAKAGGLEELLKGRKPEQLEGEERQVLENMIIQKSSPYMEWKNDVHDQFSKNVWKIKQIIPQNIKNKIKKFLK